MNADYCWYDQNSHDKTYEVTLHTNKTNAFGLADMSGNILEWCQDSFIDNYETGPNDSRSRSGNGSTHVNRGGSKSSEDSYCRSANRYSSATSFRHDSIGFRAARTLRREIGDKEGALEDYTKAIALNPKNAEAYTSRGVLRQEMGDKEGALADYTKAIALNP